MPWSIDRKHFALIAVALGLAIVAVTFIGNYPPQVLRGVMLHRYVAAAAACAAMLSQKQSDDALCRDADRATHIF